MAQDEKSPGGKAQLKVELDLDDAPFLDDDPEEAEKPAAVTGKADAPAQLNTTSVPEAKPGNKKKKLLIAGVGGAVTIVLAVVVSVFLFFGGDTPLPPPPPPPEPTVEEQAKTPPSPPPVQEYIMQWEPFWVELKDTEGASRFLTITFSTPTTNQVLLAEMNGKKYILRDALFYYLRNQPIISLSDEEKATTLKSDLLTVLNEHLGSGKVNDILIQEYLLQ